MFGLSEDVSNIAALLALDFNHPLLGLLLGGALGFLVDANACLMHCRSHVSTIATEEEVRALLHKFDDIRTIYISLISL